MSRAPIEIMLDSVDWSETGQEPPEKPDGLYATHVGVLEIAGHKLRCYRLNNGQAVFNADDFKAFFDDLI